MRRNRSNIFGGVSVEFIMITAFVLVPILAGLYDLGRLVRTDLVLNRAAREGAISLMRYHDHVSSVNEYLTASGLDPTRATISLSGGSGADNVLSISYVVPDLPLIPIPGVTFSDTVGVSAIYNRP